MADKIRVGVIGAHAERGWATGIHLPALTELPDYDITAVAATSAANAAAAANRWGAGHSFDDPHRLITHPDVDLVTIAVQLPRRRGLVEAAIAAGKHVYSEWPLAIDADTAAGFRDRAAAAGVRSAVGLQSRHHPEIRYLRDLLAQAHIGEVLSASLTYSLSTSTTSPSRYAALFDESQGVNHLTIVGGHAMDMFRFAVGEFTELSATLATRIARVTLAETEQEITVTSPDQIAVNGLLASGAVASVHIMTGGPKGSGYRIEVHGTAGRLVLLSDDDSLVAPRLTLFHDDGRNGPAPLPVPPRYHPVLANAPSAVANVHAVYSGLAQAIRTGHATQPDLDTAVGMHRMLDAIKRAAATGSRQRLG